MNSLYDFEVRVIRELVSVTAESGSIRKLLRESIVESVQWLPHGYRVTANHAAFRDDQLKVADFPYVFGAYENTRTRFNVAIRNGCLELECHSTDGAAVPVYFRERHVQIDVLNHWVGARNA